MKHRFNTLDIFRGIFASLVVFYHMSGFSETPILSNSFIKNSDMFVDFFFVLSGFVICYSYTTLKTSLEVKNFLLKRIIRIYPLHLILLLIFLLVEGIKLIMQNHVQINNILDNTPLTFFTSLFLINSIKIPGVHDYSWNGVSWSISAEFISYIFYAIVCFGMTKLYFNKFKPFLYVVISISSFIILMFITQLTKLNYGYDYGFLRGLTGFFTGAACLYCFEFFYKKLQSLSFKWFTVFEIIALTIVILSIVNGDYLKKVGFVYEFIFFIAIFTFAFERGLISKLMIKSNFLRNTGKYSYSIYMTHGLILSIFNVVFIRILKLDPFSYSYLFILNYIIIYFVSAWTFKNIEMRFQKKGAKLINRTDFSQGFNVPAKV